HRAARHPRRRGADRARRAGRRGLASTRKSPRGESTPRRSKETEIVTLLAVIVPVAILGALVLGAVMFFQRGAAGIDASPRPLLRVYLYGRRTLETVEERTSSLRRGYYLLGTAIFGIASIVLVPMAVYNTLHWFLIPVAQFEFRQGAGESLAAAIAVVPFWILFLRIVLADYRSGRVPTEPMRTAPAS